MGSEWYVVVAGVMSALMRLPFGRNDNIVVGRRLFCLKQVLFQYRQSGNISVQLKVEGGNRERGHSGSRAFECVFFIECCTQAAATGSARHPIVLKALTSVSELNCSL